MPWTSHESVMIDTFTTFSPSKPRLVKFIFRTDQRMVEEEWSPNLIFDLIGSWGAFWSSLLLIVGLPAAFYNEKKWNFLVAENQIALGTGSSPVLNVLEKRIARSNATGRKESGAPNPLSTISNFLKKSLPGQEDLNTSQVELKKSDQMQEEDSENDIESGKPDENDIECAKPAAEETTEEEKIDLTASQKELKDKYSFSP